MNRVVMTVCTGFAAASAIALAAAPALAEPASTIAETAASPAASNAPIFVPLTGWDAVYNTFMCQLQTISADAPCIYT
ncbi:hypothetical protein [Nocardia callitridis]|uniref:Uncharacterized protein n=1 Tax=Nocardia callitridis TaxID=648753 RepID=A0ABP9KTW9_9NOCA